MVRWCDLKRYCPLLPQRLHNFLHVLESMLQFTCSSHETFRNAAKCFLYTRLRIILTTDTFILHQKQSLLLEILRTNLIQQVLLKLENRIEGQKTRRDVTTVPIPHWKQWHYLQLCRKRIFFGSCFCRFPLSDISQFLQEPGSVVAHVNFIALSSNMRPRSVLYYCLRQ